MSASLKRLIHVGCRELGLDADTRHDLQLQVTGKASLTDMTEGELKLVVDALKSKGFAVKGGRKPKRKQAERRDTRLIHVLWTKLGEAGALRDPNRAGLNAFIRARFGGAWGAVPGDVDMITDWKQIDAVIQALKNMGRAHGIDFDWGRGRT